MMTFMLRKGAGPAGLYLLTVPARPAAVSGGRGVTETRKDN
jgi:hypothetical protein